MVLGLAMLGATGISGLIGGLGMGFGYGYGVRAGYNAWKPSKNQETNALHTSLNPIEGSYGAGMLTAEQITESRAKKAGLNPVDEVTPEVDPNAGQGYWQRTPHYESRDGRKITKSELNSIASKHNMSKREAYQRWVRQQYPFQTSGNYKRKGKYRYS